MWKFLDGKKTYIAAGISALLGFLGVADEVVSADPAGIANGIGIALAAAATFYGRWKVTQSGPVVKRKKRKARVKKEVVDV